MPSVEPYLTFEAGGLSFALAGSAVREVRLYADASGVPLVDLSRFLGRAKTEIGPETCVIVLNMDAGRGGESIGMLVDAATDVAQFSASDLVALPDFGPRIQLPYVAALTRGSDGFVIVLNLEHVLESAFCEAEMA